MRSSAFVLLGAWFVGLACACEGSSAFVPNTPAIDAAVTQDATNDATAATDAGLSDSATNDASQDAVDAGKILAAGLIDPIAYKSIADSPFTGVNFPSYLHFEDWEDGALNTPGVVSSSATLSSALVSVRRQRRLLGGMRSMV